MDNSSKTGKNDLPKKIGDNYYTFIFKKFIKVSVIY